MTSSCPPKRPRPFAHYRQKLGKSKRGLTNRSLSPKFSEKIGGKSFLENRAFSGQIGAFSGPFQGRSGPFRGQLLRTPQPQGKSRNCPKGPFLAQLAPFGSSPRLLSPCLDFPEKIRFPEFGPKFGFRRCKIPCADICPRRNPKGDGRTENVINCPKLSQIVVTFYDEFYDDL